MAAKNIKNRNLANEIQKSILDAANVHYRTARGFANPLKYKEVSTDYVKDQIRHTDFIDKINAQIKRAENNVAAQQATYREVLADKLTIKGANPTEELLAETRATKQWNRLERELAGKDRASALGLITNAVSNASAKGDQATLASIVAEAPSFLRGKGVKDPDRVLETIIRTQEPDLARAHAAVAEAEQVVAVTRYNVGLVTKGVTASIDRGITEYKIEDLPDYDKLLDPRTVIKGTYDPSEDLKEALNDPAADTEDNVELTDQTSDNASETTEATESRFHSNEPTSAPGLN